MGNKKRLRKELAALLKREKNEIVRRWSTRIFRVPAYRRLKDIIPEKLHAAAMDRRLRALIFDIAHSQASRQALLKKLVFKDYLSASTTENVVRGQLILRAILADLLQRTYKGQSKKLKDLMSVIISEIDRNILYFSMLYRKRDFARLGTIMRYGKKLIAIHDLDRLCRLILEAAVKECNPDRASLMLLGKDGYLHIKSSIGIAKRIVSRVRQEVGSGIAGRVAETAAPITINEGQKLTPGLKKSLLGLGVKSAVSIPIIADSKVMGVLNLGKYHKKPFFDEEDVELLMILAYEAGAAINNCQLIEELQNFYIGSMVSLASALDARDHSTQGHSEKVGRLAVSIARKLKLPNEQVDRVKSASMLHDIGKIGIPDSILLKPARLNKREFAVIKKHPIFAVKILKHIPRLKSIIPIIYHEHERYDGKGYVDGIKGNEIPIESRIIAVADAYEAMTSDRPYRKALAKREAVAELRRGSGTQFDPAVVTAFLMVIKK